MQSAARELPLRHVPPLHTEHCVLRVDEKPVAAYPAAQTFAVLQADRLPAEYRPLGQAMHCPAEVLAPALGAWRPAGQPLQLEFPLWSCHLPAGHRAQLFDLPALGE